MRFLAVYQSVNFLDKYLIYSTWLVSGGVLIRCILDIHKCREEDMPVKEIIRRQKKYLMVGVIVLCLSAFIKLIQRYYT
ncbi:hypothetical protein [Fusibacillus kribbianus]|uniref:Uncharacterized protein n=1 Tax=Fusibacillus kribbianus TaxID=3044208 RepID=A0AAP4F0I6_9FIRM|nr:hypothetical protein [Ruminococcus sp. YH-rum2234]MDI9241918.1 hypothetical protein [Ruminococcus sp. YH-rum2234]